ncbi:hypothetical protein J31TS4_39710 [Paenibacillus sp. J31TS4]|nr:hypothetical protein J31TS4_39710 [Paenibacillus sp. J31TS4]
MVTEMIDLARLTQADHVLDLGAGTGALTVPLADRAGHVVAIENDPAFVRKLTNKLAGRTNVVVRLANILETAWPRKPFCVVANIPYAITTSILRELLDSPSVSLKRAVLLVEKGAAKRFTASPTADPSILAWRMRFSLRLVRTVPPGDFSPPPQVESAILLISQRQDALLSPNQQTRFRAFAAYALRQPQLPLDAALAPIFTPPQLAKLARLLQLAKSRPVGLLKEEQWERLFLAMLQHVDPVRWPRLPKERKRSRGRN